MRRPNDHPVIAGSLINGTAYDPLVAEMIDLLRKKILIVERIPPENKENKNSKYYHNYKYFIFVKNREELLPYEKFIVDFISKYKDPSKEYITQEELEKKAEVDPEFKNFIDEWYKIISTELCKHNYLDPEELKKRKKKNPKWTPHGKERRDEWVQYRKYLNKVIRKDLNQKSMSLWEEHLTYAASFYWRQDGEKINKAMDKIYPTQEERKKSNLFIEGIAGNDYFFSEYTFFAPLDFGINFADFIYVRSTK